MASKGKKAVADSFSSSQPGYISVAGETFFLNLPTDDSNTIGSKLVDDSLKGDTSFQRLFLGDKPKEQDPKAPFSAQEQIDLRRIFRAIFGISKGPKGIALPCSKKDLDLLLKSLEIRRKVLIAQINAYDSLASPDVHARYMREHLIRLNKLIGDEIPNTLAPCVLTDVVDPTAPPRLPLDDARMLRLLEIFAYLLAQGKDPLTEFQKTQPQAMDILPRMAVKNAPGLKEYEDAYAKVHPHKVPEYTETLLKIKKILQGEVATGDATLDKQLQQAFESIEKAFGIAEPKGSFSDRADFLIKRLAAMEKEKKDDIAEIMKTKAALAAKQSEFDELALKEKACQEQLTKVKGEKTALEAELAKAKADLAAANDTMKTLEAGLAAANESIKKLEEALTAATEAKAAAEKALLAANEAKAAAESALAAANEAKTAAEAALTAATTTLTKLQEDLAAAEAAKVLAESQFAAANKTIEGLTAELKEARDAEAAIRAQVADLQTQKDAAEGRVAELSGELAKKNGELAELNQQKAALEAQLNALLEVVPDLTPVRLRELLNAEGLVETLNEQIADLRRQLAACPPAEELTRLQKLVEDLQMRPTQEAYDELQRTVEGLRTQLEGRDKDIEGMKPFADRIRQLDGLLQEPLTLERLWELLHAEESIERLTARISELEGRPNITQAAYETLEGQLRDARNRITELEKRPDITEKDLENIQKDLEKALRGYEETIELLKKIERAYDIAKASIKQLQAQRAELEGQLAAANAKLKDCEELKKKLANTQLQLEDRKARVISLENKVAALEKQINNSSGDAATIRKLIDEKTVLEALSEKLKADFAASQKEVVRLNAELTKVISERDARPTRQELDDVSAQRDGIAAQRDTLIGQRNAIKAERNAAIAARDTAAGERNAAITERDRVAGERNAAIAARNTAAGERNAAIAARDTAAGERNAAIAARDTAAGERNAAIAARDTAAGERNAAITAQQALQAKVATLEEQIRSQGVYKVVYTRLKEILGIQDGIELPTQGQVDELLGTVQTRIRGAPVGNVNKTHLCLLNLVFTLLRRLTMKQGITTDSGLRYTPEKVQAMFGSILGKSLTPVNEAVLTVFSFVLKKLLENGVPLRGEVEVYSALEVQLFVPTYTQIDILLGNPLFFTNDDKAVASAFLNQFFTNEYDFTKVYLQSNGKLKIKEEREDLGLVNIASLFLLVLTSTQQILRANKESIEAAGCAVPQVNLKPAPLPVVPEPQPAVLTEQARCRPGIVPGTRFERRAMPSLNQYNKWDSEKPASRELKELYAYLKQINNSEEPVGPLCKVSIDGRPSEANTFEKLVHKFEKPHLWQTAMLPSRRDGPRVDPASIGPRAGIPSGRGGTRKRKAANKHKTKKMRKA